jgi:hypothetical protein
VPPSRSPYYGCFVRKVLVAARRMAEQLSVSSPFVCRCIISGGPGQWFLSIEMPEILENAANCI